MSSIVSKISNRINQAPDSDVWATTDFVDLGTLDTIDRTLRRLASKGQLQKIGRGLYAKTRINPLTDKPTVPNYQKVIETIIRRSQGRMLIDGMTAANALGLTNTVPSRVIIHTDCRSQPIQLDKLTIQFKLTAPSKLYWAGHPAMYIVQALYWLHSSIESLSQEEYHQLISKLQRIIHHSKNAAEIYQDLLDGIHTTPSWMQALLRKLLNPTNDELGTQ